MKLSIILLLFSISIYAKPITEVQVKHSDVTNKVYEARAGLEIKEDQLEKYFKKGAIKVIKKSIDFTKQKLLVFGWRGSGGDKIDYVVLESYPEQIAFTKTRGRTRDLRSHIHIYVLRKNVSWSIK